MAKVIPDEIKRPEQIIYAGPNLPGGVLQRYTVFKGGTPAHIKQIIEKCPAIQGLFVSVDKFAVTEQSISVAGSAENALFGQVVDYIKKGGK